jgi:multiple sugar transport system permease protein
MTHRLNLDRQKQLKLTGLLLISPWLLGVILLKLFPIVASLVLSLTNFYLLKPDEVQFVGLENYIKMISEPNTWDVLQRTVSLALWLVPTQLIVSVVLAAILSSRYLRMRSILRTLFFLPSIIPSVAAGYMFQDFFSPGRGWFSRLILAPIGLDGIIRLSGRSGSQPLFIITSLWIVGPSMLILMGAMQGISNEIYESARVDGATPLRSFFSITLPLISPAIFFSLILNLTAAFGGSILLDLGYTFNSNQSSFDGYIYFYLFRLFRLGSATSLAWIFFVLVMTLVMILFITSRYWVFYPDREQ